MGSPDFAVPALYALAEVYSVVGVITQPDKPAGRGKTLTPPPVKTAAQALGLPILQPQRLRDPEAMRRLREWTPDLAIVAAFGQILKPEALNLPRLGCLNLHASLLPRWRGASPIQAALLAGDDETGITLMKMDPGMDTGPILAQTRLPILPDDTGGSLFEKLSQRAAQFALETLPAYLAGELSETPQPSSGVTYAPMLKKEDGLLDFSQPAQALERRVRAMRPWPGAFFALEGTPLKVHRARVQPAISAAEPGQRLVFQGLPALQTSAGLLLLEEVQPAGKRSMPGQAFLAGARNW